MMTLITNNPVELHSNASGGSARQKGKSQAENNRIFSQSAKQTRQSARHTAKTTKASLKDQKKAGAISKQDFRAAKKAARKAKRNATKLQILKRFTKDGKPLFVYRLKALVQDQKLKKSMKRMPDGSTIEVSPMNVVNTPQGAYDLSEIAKAMNVSVESLRAAQAQLIDILVPLASSSTNKPEATPAEKTDPNADLGVTVPASNVVETEPGNFYAAEDTYDQSQLKAGDPEPDVKNDEKPPLTTFEKALIGGGIAIILLAVGVLIYKKMKGNGTGK